MMLALGAPFLFTLLAGAAAASDGPAKTYSECQQKTLDPLDGCPDGTLYVSKDDAAAPFSAIQDAIRSLPNDTSSHVILIAEGIYVEQLNVTRPGPLTLLGQSDDPANDALYSDVTYNTTRENKVQIFQYRANSAGSFPDNVHTSVLVVGPTYNATLTGAGPTGYPVDPATPFGCSDFRAYNIDFRNDAAPRSAGPSHAIGIGYANAGFYSCGFYSYQDTVFVGKLANTIMYDSIIAGQTDYLYGFGTLFVDKSTLLNRNCGGGVTAWKGTNTTFENKYGVYVADSQIIASNTSILEIKRGQCSLGRPWNSIHRSVIMDTYLDEAILPAGYTVWGGSPQNFNNLTTMAVYETFGPGNDDAAQKAGNVTLVWEKEDVRPYFRPLDVFMTWHGEQPNVDWIDPIVRKSQCKRS